MPQNGTHIAYDIGLRRIPATQQPLADRILPLTKLEGSSRPTFLQPLGMAKIERVERNL